MCRLRCCSLRLCTGHLIGFIVETYCTILSWIIWCIPVCIIEWIISILPPLGITFNGPNPWDPKLLNPKRFYASVAWGTLGLYKSLSNDWVQVDDLAGMFFRFTTSPFIKKYGQWVYPFKFLHRWFDLNAPELAAEQIAKSYTVGKVQFPFSDCTNAE